MKEPLEVYLEAFDKWQANVEKLFETTRDLTDLEATASRFLIEPPLLHVFRYLAGPPISLDDLCELAEVALKASQLTKDVKAIRRIVGVVQTAIDRRRFPWVREGRAATNAEKFAAILATAALIATQRVGTSRRNEGKTAQEARVQEALASHAYKEVKRRAVRTIADAPAKGEFCAESLFGGRKADFIIRLWDDRVMPLECKVSNSAVNSVKRLNNDAAAKAEAWRADFGTRHVVPVAVLSGVFKLRNLVDAQQRGLTLFWAHNLKALTDWIEKTRSA